MKKGEGCLAKEFHISIVNGKFSQASLDDMMNSAE
jgi:hypothetical protein